MEKYQDLIKLGIAVGGRQKKPKWSSNRLIAGSGRNLCHAIRIRGRQPGLSEYQGRLAFVLADIDGGFYHRWGDRRLFADLYNVRKVSVVKRRDALLGAMKKSTVTISYM